MNSKFIVLIAAAVFFSAAANSAGNSNNSNNSGSSTSYCDPSRCCSGQLLAARDAAADVRNLQNLQRRAIQQESAARRKANQSWAKVLAQVKRAKTNYDTMIIRATNKLALEERMAERRMKEARRRAGLLCFNSGWLCPSLENTRTQNNLRVGRAREVLQNLTDARKYEFSAVDEQVRAYRQELDGDINQAVEDLQLVRSELSKSERYYQTSYNQLKQCASYYGYTMR